MCLVEREAVSPMVSYLLGITHKMKRCRLVKYTGRDVSISGSCFQAPISLDFWSFLHYLSPSPSFCLSLALVARNQKRMRKPTTLWSGKKKSHKSSHKFCPVPKEDVSGDGGFLCGWRGTSCKGWIMAYFIGCSGHRKTRCQNVKSVPWMLMRFLWACFGICIAAWRTLWRLRPSFYCAVNPDEGPGSLAPSVVTFLTGHITHKNE